MLKEKVKYLVPAVVATGATALPVFANETTVTTAMTSAITSIASDALSGLQSIIPVAAPIMGGLLMISVGIRTFKKFTRG